YGHQKPRGQGDEQTEPAPPKLEPIENFRRRAGFDRLIERQLPGNYARNNKWNLLKLNAAFVRRQVKPFRFAESSPEPIVPRVTSHPQHEQQHARDSPK